MSASRRSTLAAAIRVPAKAVPLANRERLLVNDGYPATRGYGQRKRLPESGTARTGFIVEAHGGATASCWRTHAT
jgi:hypothetical protein